MYTLAGLEAALRHNIVEFEFVKKDGSHRSATGTLNPKWIANNTAWTPVGGISSPKVLPFYDLDKGAWRSLQRSARILSIRIITYLTKK